MKQQPFRFKMFEVAQDLCAMKVNTDGVLLGAWACSKLKNSVQFVLDIGTGSGVIALMLAQVSQQAKVDAIDIDELSCKQAKFNFEQSNWSERLAVFSTPLQQFSSSYKYDVIVSNPPYFVDDLKTKDYRKNNARHSASLSYVELINGCSNLLNETGSCFIVIPAHNFMLFQTIAAQNKLFVNECMSVSAVEGKEPYILLLHLQRLEIPCRYSTLSIQHRDGNFSNEYIALTKLFYLKF